MPPDTITTPTPARYPDRRTATAHRPLTSGRRAARCTAAELPPYALPGPGPATTVARTRAHEDAVTTQWNDTTDEHAVPTRVIDDTLCTNRAGIAHLAGWKPGNSVNVRARTDPDFPEPLPHKVDRQFWYPLEDRVDPYIALLADRAAAKKPPPVKPGDPHDELYGDAAADALHINYQTLRSYIRYSKPYWDGVKHGRPLLPKPDKIEPLEHEKFGPYRRRTWYRGTLAAHQAIRPGPGGTGRPPHQ